MNHNLVGQQLGKYRIKDKIGSGGMGTVFKAYDPTLDRYAAVKVLAPHLVWQEEAIERFLREARAAARLRHPSIVTIYDVGQEKDCYYFAMEYLEGQTLTEILQERGSLPWPEVLSILRPLAAALDYAHGEGLVHRDIKPGNVVVGSQGRVTLTDFGIVHAAQQSRLTATGTLVGTPEYMSPEQAKGLTVDARSDQYSLGVVAYEMLGGRVPFSAESPFALLYKVTQEPLPDIREARPDLPVEAEQALAKALAKQPDDRYPTTTAFVDALEQAIVAETERATEPREAAPLPDAATVVKKARAQAPARGRLPEPTRRIPVWAWAVGGVAALGLTVGIVMAARSGHGGAPPTQEAAQPTTAVVPAAAAGTDTESPTPSPTETPSPTGSPTATPTTTSTPTTTPTMTPTVTPTETPTVTPTERPAEATSTDTPEPRAVAPELT
ncbi:MAG: serine/threonine-protein kinase, partial [Chloroflexota bacterium]